MPSLSDAQLGDLVRRMHDPAQGGFTIDPNTGADIPQGVSVAPHGNERQIPADQTTSGDLQNYVVRNAARFRTGDAFGGWHNQGTDFLDTPRVYPDQPSGHEDARAAMVKNRQLAGFDLGTFTEQPNPFHPGMRPQIGMERHEIADAALSNPQFALNQPEVQAWAGMPREVWKSSAEHRRLRGIPEPAEDS